jgi:hypothetical protein
MSRKLVAPLGVLAAGLLVVFTLVVWNAGPNEVQQFGQMTLADSGDPFVQRPGRQCREVRYSGTNAGSPGTRLRIWASGCTTRIAITLVRQNSAPVVLKELDPVNSTVLGRGGFKAEVTVPPEIHLGYWTITVGTPGLTAEWWISFHVTGSGPTEPWCTLPPGGAPLTSVVLRCGNLQGAMSVEAWLRGAGSNMRLASGSTDLDGNLALTITVPDLPPRQYSIHLEPARPMPYVALSFAVTSAS